MQNQKQKEVTVNIIPEYKELYSDKWRYLIYYGGRGSGKSYNVAESLILLGRERKLRILCTREVQNTIKDSVHKLLCDIIEKYGFSDYKTTKDSIINSKTGTEFIFKGLRHNIAEIKSTEGIDVCWVEEGQGVSKESWEILTPTIRKPKSRIIVTLNRLNENDPVWVKFCIKPSSYTYISKVNYDVMEKYGLFPDVLKLEMEADKESNPTLYAWKWLGEPLGQSDKAIISKTAIMEAMEREADEEGAIEIGVDVARLGSDRTVFKKRKGMQIKGTKILTKRRTNEVCDELEVFASFNKNIVIKIDDTGVGGGVTDQMLARGYNVIAINFGEKAKDPNKYPNLISEAWFEFSELINQIGLNGYDSDLLTELSNREWSMDSKGRRAVESKDSYKKRGFRSPDLADSLMLAFYTPKIEPKIEWADDIIG